MISRAGAPAPFMNFDVQTLSSAVAVLTAMITPALLISACGTFILSTSNRLGRIVDRVRILSHEFEQMVHSPQDVELVDERRDLILSQIDWLAQRANFLQRGLTSFYVASGIFISTSVALGIVAVVTTQYQWIPVLLALLGGAFFFYGSILMLFEARLALSSLRAETAFLLKLVRLHPKS